MKATLSSFWKNILRYRIAIIIIVLLFIITLAIVKFGWGWTGLAGKTLWDWLQLLFIPVLLVIGGFWLNEEKGKILKLFGENEQPEPILYVEWSYFISREHETIQNGEKLDRRITPMSEVELSLQNKSKKRATDIVVTLQGNANLRVTPSDFFDGPSGDMTLSQIIIWRAKPNHYLYSLRETFEYAHQNLATTNLHLGTVQWDRDEGIYWLQISVTAEEMGKAVKFELAMSPFQPKLP